MLYDVYMNRTTMLEFISFKNPSAWTPRRKSRFLWALTTLVFLVFNTVYWPVHWRQTLSNPALIEEYVEHIASTRSIEDARQALRQGLEHIRPPAPEPYALAARMESQAAEEETAQLAANRAIVYRTLHQMPVNIPNLLPALQSAANLLAVSEVDAPSAGLVRRATTSFTAALHMREAAASFSVAEQISLLTLTGSVFSCQGKIGKTSATAPVPMLAYSGGGMDARRDAHIFVGGIDYADRQRGMHVVLIHATSGLVQQMGAFDLWTGREEAHRLTQFLLNAPKGCIGLFAVRDDGGANMTPALENALMGFGLERAAWVERAPAILGLRYSFAAIGVKGAAPGTALQAWCPEQYQGYRGFPVACGVLKGEAAP